MFWYCAKHKIGKLILFYSMNTLQRGQRCSEGSLSSAEPRLLFVEDLRLCLYYIHTTQEKKAYLESLQRSLLLFPSDLIKAFILRVRAAFVAAWSLVPRDRCTSFLPSLGTPRHSWVHLSAASGFVQGICEEDDQIVILWIWEFIYDCVRDLRFWILFFFLKCVLEFSFCCRYCKGLLSTITFILITELLRQWKHACETICISKVTYVTPVFKNCTWFWCCVIVFVAFAATCSENTEFHALREIPVHFLLSPSTLFLYQYIILRSLEISSFRVIIIVINSFLAISPR